MRAAVMETPNGEEEEEACLQRFSFEASGVGRGVGDGGRFKHPTASKTTRGHHTVLQAKQASLCGTRHRVGLLRIKPDGSPWRLLPTEWVPDWGWALGISR